MPTVGTLAYQIVANTSNFTQGLTGSRKELKTLKDAFLSSITPAEKYGAAIAHLESLAEKFPDKAAVIQRSIAQMRAEMTPASTTSKVLTDVLGRMGIVIDPVSAAFQALHVATGVARAGLQAVHDIAGKVMESMERLDETAKKARLLGVDPAQLIGLRRAAEDIAGVASEGFDAAFKKFGVNIGTAAMTGKGPAADAMKRLGLSAKELSGMSLFDALMKVADAMEQVENVDERLALSKGILGKGGEELAPMLAAGREEIQKLVADQQHLSQAEFIDFKSIEEANDQIGRFSTLIQSIFDLLASEFAPLVKDVFGDMTDGLSDANNQGKGLRDTIQLIAFTTAALVDEIEGIAGATNKLGNSIPAWMRPWLPGFREADLASGLSGLVQPSGAAGTRLGGMTQNAQDRLNGLNKDKVKTVGEIQKQEDAKEVAREAARAKRLADAKERATKADKAKHDALDKRNLEGLAEGQRQAEEMRRKQEDELFGAQEKAFMASRTPAEKLRMDLEELTSLRRRGGMTDETYQRSLMALRAQARDIADVEKVTPQSIGAIRAGSIEALRAGMEKPVTEKQLEEAKKQTEEAKEANKLLTEINAKLAAPPIKEAV